MIPRAIPMIRIVQYPFLERKNVVLNIAIHSCPGWFGERAERGLTPERSFRGRSLQVSNPRVSSDCNVLRASRFRVRRFQLSIIIRSTLGCLRNQRSTCQSLSTLHHCPETCCVLEGIGVLVQRHSQKQHGRKSLASDSFISQTSQ